MNASVNVPPAHSVRARVRVRAGVAALLALAAGGVAFAQAIDPTSDPNVRPYGGTPVNGYVLQWSDEFNGAAVDTNKWDFRTGVRYWSVQQRQNNSVSNGLYRLHVRKEQVGTNSYTAGGIISKSLHRYGYYETRMRVPPGRGWHTSFWMMRFNSPPEEPVSIELDALENDSVSLSKYSVNIHRHKPAPHVTFGNKTVNTPSLNADFHVVGCEFTPAQVRYFFNGAVVQTVDATQFPHNDMNIWLTSVAAPLGGTTNVDDTLLPNVAEYDYVRFFVRGPTGSVSIVSPSGGVQLTETNLELRVAAVVSTSDSNHPPAVLWSKLSGPGVVTFGSPNNPDTTATFSAPGHYVLQCQVTVGGSLSADQIGVGVKAPVAVSLRQGVRGYEHIATFIRGDNVNWNAGARDQIIVGRWGGQPLRSILSFDLASLAPDALIQSATLDVWTDATAGVGTLGEVELRRLNGTPIEGTGNSSTDPSNGAGTGATWLSRTGGTNAAGLWTSPGGDFETNLLASVPGYDATLTGVQKTFGPTPELAAAAQAALDARQPLNLALLSPSTEKGASNFISRISSDDSSLLERRPQLTLSLLGNFAPYVFAGGRTNAMAGLITPLEGAVSHALGCAWSMMDGPAAVTFDNPSQPATTVVFPEPGRYMLRLTASNPLAQVSQNLPVEVAAFFRPQVLPASTGGGQFQLQVTGEPGLNYTVQGSTNLTTWINLFTTNPGVMPFYWTDMGATNLPARFYRALLGP